MITIGSFIRIEDTKEPPYDENGNFAPYMRPLYMHEYGHYLQSQEYGFGYLFSVGIPSIWDLKFGNGSNKDKLGYNLHRLRWFEIDANKRAFKHFEGLYNHWDYLRYPIIEPY